MANVNCPHCQESFDVGLIAEIPDKQKLYSEITYEGEWLSAETVGGLVTDMAKLLEEIAKDMGSKVHVFIDSIQYGDHKFKVGYLITSTK